MSKNKPYHVVCPYCGKDAEYVDSREVYKKSYGMIYLCRPCDAYVGTHGSGKRPKGSLANKELRGLRIVAHRLFDPFWKNSSWERNQAYEWLSRVLGIERSQCHIAMFDEATCRRAIEACKCPPPARQYK